MAVEDGPDDRLSALEERLAALEALVERAIEGRSRDAPSPPVNVDETFWALEGLRARYGDGGVLYTGSVRLPTGGEVRWQRGTLTPDVLESDWAARAETLAALGHPVRLRLLHHVLHGATTAHELTDTDGVGSSGQVYHHLRQLVATGWLRSIGGGRHEVPAARVVPLLVILEAALR